MPPSNLSTHVIYRSQLSVLMCRHVIYPSELACPRRNEIPDQIIAVQSPNASIPIHSALRAKGTLIAKLRNNSDNYTILNGMGRLIDLGGLEQTESR
ncbi:hypothetical protein KIN20_037251 [Parelaphostrongylus tenuis]|uniref:Uncharacterized protein n=1 Tax=Parelaphostrongylus tenuis TaxID=148309 RepID=A0AAD5WMB0_PARTN|nr:hypothetical protein KIN20_037251 [Parelaphostrongylus tenuis]